LLFNSEPEEFVGGKPIRTRIVGNLFLNWRKNAILLIDQIEGENTSIHSDAASSQTNPSENRLLTSLAQKGFPAVAASE
jgi:hypothetical protein